MNAQKIIILAAYFIALLLVVASATTNDFYESDKRANNRPFMMGMRYGRTDKAMMKGGKQHVVVAPRNDRFFLGSRYGKRSSDDASSFIYPLCGMTNDLTCTYTGVSNIYRCIQSFDKDSTLKDELSTSM